MAFWYWLLRPKLGLARFRYWLWERAHPNEPWMCPGTVAFCRTHLSPSMAAVEFGSGRSTLWFSKQVGSLVSVEHNAEWYETVKQQLAQASVRNLDYRLVPLNHPESEAERAEYATTPDYVAVIDSLENQSVNFAVVDGHYRTHCVRHLIPKMAPGGYLLVDDINLWASPSELPIPADWSIVDDSTNGIKRCIIWQTPVGKDS